MVIIRSQNKKAIANFDNIDSIGVERKHCGCDVVGYNGTRESCVKLGEYSTEEKAIKVSDMIQEHYAKMRSADCTMVGAIKNVISLNWQTAECMFENHKSMYVFEMPDDNEVKV